MSNNNIETLLDEAIKAHNTNNIKLAEKNYHTILYYEPNHEKALSLLALLYCNKGILDKGEILLKKLIEIAPENYEYHYNLGNLYLNKGILKEAIKYFNTSIKLNRTFDLSYSNCGLALQNLGYINEAINYYEKALQVNPNNPNTYNNYANLLNSIENFDLAIVNYKRAVELNKKNYNFLRNLALIYEVIGDIEKSKEYYLEVLKLNSNNLILELYTENITPPISLSNYEIDSYRNRFLKMIEEYTKKDFANNTFIDTSLCITTGLIYQGRNDKILKEKCGFFFNKLLSPQNNYIKQKAIKPYKIGFVITKNTEKAFIRYMKGIIENFSKGKFSITIIYSEPNSKMLFDKSITNKTINYLYISENIPSAVQILKNAKFELLYYWEVGTNPTNYLIPFFKPAPIQCTSYGFAVTSGIPQIDYYISAEALEVGNSKDYYTEKLIKFKHLPTFFYKSKLHEGELKTRSYFGFKAEDKIYLCTQNLRKIHPDFDELVKGILEQDKQGKIVFVESNFPELTKILKLRLKVKLEGLAERIVFIKRLSPPDYLSLVYNADVILDTIYFSGALTSYDALGLGKPVVCLPKDLARSRYTYALCKELALEELIAKDEKEYINIAVKLANDKVFNQEVSKKILAKVDKIFENFSAVEELETFFEKVITDTNSII